MIYLYCASLPDNLSLTETAEYLKAYFPGESNSEYIENIGSRAPARAAEGLFSLLLLSRMIDDHFPICKEGSKLILARNENGKPSFQDGKPCFNISHSGGIVACALSDNGEVGVDIEAARPTSEKARKLSSRYFSTDEVEEINGDPERFIMKWTEKEAITKFFGANLADFVKKSDKKQEDPEFSIHSFKYRKMPITLCTKRNFDKIIFCVLDY